MGLRTQGNTKLYLPSYYIIKEMIEDTDEEPDEEIHKMRSGSVLSVEASVLVELECGTLWPCRCVHPF